MSVGDVVARTWHVVVSRLGLLLGVLATYFVAQLAMFLVLGIMMGVSMATGFMTDNLAAMTGSMIGMMILFYLLYFLIFFAQSGSLALASSPVRRPSFSEVLTIGMRSAPSLLGVAILFGIGYFILAIGLGLIGGIFALAGTAGVVVFAVVALAVALFFVCRLCVLNAVVAVDGVLNPVGAISRSWALTRGRSWSILGSIVALAVTCMLLIGVVFAPFYLIMNSVREGGAEPGALVVLGMFVVIVFVVAFTAIAVSAVTSVIHAVLVEESGEGAADIFG